MRCDQRGVRFSTGHPSQGGLDVQALDDLMCVRYLKSRTDVNISKIGIIGCDHGGLLAIKCAAYSADVAYIVLLGTPSLDGTNEILEKNKSISKAEGMSDRAVSLQYNLVSDIIETVKKDEDDEMALEDIRKIAMVYGNAMTEDDKNELKNFFQVFNIADRGLASRQWRYAINYDPHDDLVKVKCPVLSLYGGKDFAVPVDENIPLFKKAMEEGKNQDYTVKVFPGLNNQFQTAKTGLFSEYAYLPETISPLVLDFIGDWIGKHAQ